MTRSGRSLWLPFVVHLTSIGIGRTVGWRCRRTVVGRWAIVIRRTIIGCGTIVRPWTIIGRRSVVVRRTIGRRGGAGAPLRIRPVAAAVASAVPVPNNRRGRSRPSRATIVVIHIHCGLGMHRLAAVHVNCASPGTFMLVNVDGFGLVIRLVIRISRLRFDISRGRGVSRRPSAG